MRQFVTCPSFSGGLLFAFCCSQPLHNAIVQRYRPMAFTRSHCNCATIQTGLYITADLTVHDHRCARNGPIADILATGGRGAVYVKNPKWFKAAASIAKHPKDTALTTALTTFRARPLLPSVCCEILGHAYGYAGIKLEPIGSTA